MSRSQRRLPALLAACCCLAGAACGGDDPSADPQPTTTQPDKSADEQALRDLAEDWYEASDAIYQHRRDPATASRFLVDPYLKAYVEQATRLVAAGRISEPSDRSRLEVLAIRVDGDEAIVTHCSIDADRLKGPDGDVINDEIYAQLLESHAVRAKEGWRFRDRTVLAEKEGTEQCPDA